MAGFGGDSKSSKKRNNKKAVPIKLKPKLQWDRYTALKGEKKFIVGIRDSSDEASEWMEVGKIKSKDHSKTEIAVAMQRGIIAEVSKKKHTVIACTIHSIVSLMTAMQHGKRLYPLQVSKKMICEWGYLENDKWKVVDVKIATFASEGFEKKIGFAGKPDLATGFYCVYDNGKIKLGEETSFT
jgi:hypothetical protein